MTIRCNYSVSVSRQGLYFAFYDQGACTTLIAVRVYYIICPSTVLNFALFPDTPTGPEMTSIVQRNGACVENAVVENVPSYLCKGDGNWYFPTGQCKCVSGFEPDALSTFCVSKSTPRNQRSLASSIVYFIAAYIYNIFL